MSFFSDSQVSFEDINDIYTQNDIQKFSSSWGLQHTIISPLQEIFTFQWEMWSWFIDTAAQRIDISEKNKYYSSLREISQTYTFHWEGFIIEQESLWEIFVDTLTSPWKVFILSMSAPVTLKLVSPDVWEEYTNIFLAPHMYIEFQPARWKSVKWADRIRVETIFKLWYIWKSFSEELSDDVALKYIWDTGGYFSTVSDYFSAQRTHSDEYLDMLSSKTVYQIPWMSLVQRYTSLFINDEKKKIYYKNSILEKYIELLNSQEYNESLLTEISYQMQSLKDLDMQAYMQVQDFASHLSGVMSRDSRFTSIPAKLLISDIYRKDSEVTNEIHLFYLYAYSLFTNYDDKASIWFKTLEQYIWSFQKLQRSWESKYERHDEYFVYFLEQYILFELENNKDVSFNQILKVLKEFNTYAWDVYSRDVTSKISGMYIYNELLYNIWLYTRGRFFNTERNQQQLLELSSLEGISQEWIRNFKANIEKIFLFMQTNAIHLDPKKQRDVNINKSFDILKVQYDEYFAALENYGNYIVQYDESKKNIFLIDTLWDDDTWLVSSENFESYIYNFVWVSSSWLKYEVVDGLFYSVESIVIWGKQLSFDIFPYQWNLLKNIVVDGELQSSQYKLDDIKTRWEEIYTWSDSSVRDAFDFKRFFLITFFDSSSGELPDEFDIKDISTTEDRAEIVFKRDKLLWDKWEFSVVGNILKVDYEDIRLEQNNSLYDIFLTNTDISTVVETSNSVVAYFWDMSSRYVLTNQDHYFTNFASSWYTKAGDNKNYFFDGEKVSFIGKLEISKLQQVVENFTKNISSYENIYKQVKIAAINTQFTLEYQTSSQKMIIKFDRWGKKYTIVAASWVIEQILEGTKKLLENSISINNIWQYIN